MCPKITSFGNFVFANGIADNLDVTIPIVVRGSRNYSPSRNILLLSFIFGTERIMYIGLRLLIIFVSLELIQSIQIVTLRGTVLILL